MLTTLIPLFDRDLNVSAYSIFSQKRDLLMNPALQGTGVNDNAGDIPGFEVIREAGIETLSPDAPVFVPVGNIAVFSDVAAQCGELPHDKIVLLIDNNFQGTPQYLDRIKTLKADGFLFAIRKLQTTEFAKLSGILQLMDYIIFDCRQVDVAKAKIFFAKMFPNVKIIIGNLDDDEAFEKYRMDYGFCMFEGNFYRIPVNHGEKGVSAVKATYLELLNTVNEPDYELTDAADVIGRDTALVVELLKTVNRMAVNSEVTSIRHATAMLGQKNLKRWINTIAAKELCSDKPSEITRISLLRAKFAENLAPLFEMAGNSSELFLMGLFSVIDLILDLPMEEALKKVLLSRQISNALLTGKGDFAEILRFMEAYENANWQEVARVMLIKGIKDKDVYIAYLSAFSWYRQLINIK